MSETKVPVYKVCYCSYCNHVEESRKGMRLMHSTNTIIFFEPERCKCCPIGKCLPYGSDPISFQEIPD